MIRFLQLLFPSSVRKRQLHPLSTHREKLKTTTHFDSESLTTDANLLMISARFRANLL